METKSKLTHVGIPNPKYESPTMRVRRLDHAIDMDEKKIELEYEDNRHIGGHVVLTLNETVPSSLPNFSSALW